MAATLGETRTAQAAPPKKLKIKPVDAIPLWLRTLAAIVGVYFILPTFIVIPMGFGGATTTFKFPPEEFSVKLFENFFTNPAWIGSLGKSALVGVLAALVASTFGTAAAVGLHFLPGRLPTLVRTLLMIPLVTPSIILAVSIYVSFLQWHLTGSLPGYVVAHAAIGLPYVLVSVTAALSSFDSTLLRASASLGASPWRSFVTVTAPLISKGIGTGALFAFVTSFDEVVIALYLRSPMFQTLPVQMYNSVTVEIDSTIAASSSLMVIIVSLILFIPQFARAKKTS
ncbi:MAG: ABC transporter permease [Propionibacteriaceae bacterium]|jgi:putative spermidine/putrescine transport system permease protein|nr:ABC transporter permease [Propionibacteriaceae bacterium]